MGAHDTPPALGDEQVIPISLRDLRYDPEVELSNSSFNGSTKGMWIAIIVLGFTLFGEITFTHITVANIQSQLDDLKHRQELHEASDDKIISAQQAEIEHLERALKLGQSEGVKR